MPWGYVATCVISSIWATRKSAKDAEAAMEDVTGVTSYSMGKQEPSKCLSCGSTHWLQHNNVRICAYCRSGQ